MVGREFCFVSEEGGEWCFVSRIIRLTNRMERVVLEGGKRSLR